jgi:hypothetical protein
LKRVLVGSFAVLVVLIALPALAKGLIGVTIEGPGIAGRIFLESDGTSESADQFHELFKATGFAEMAWGAVVTGENQLLTEQPEGKLGSEYRLTWIQMGPEGDVEMPALLYPFAAGGPLVYMEPDIEIIENSSVARGGWFASSYDIAAILQEYGVDVSAVKSTSTPVEVEPVKSAPLAMPDLAAVETPSTSMAVPIAVGAGLLLMAVLAGFWAMGRRPRRLGTS